MFFRAGTQESSAPVQPQKKSEENGELISTYEMYIFSLIPQSPYEVNNDIAPISQVLKLRFRVVSLGFCLFPLHCCFSQAG